MAGHATYYGNLLDHEIPWDLDLAGIGRLLALTPNDEVNTLATRRFAELFTAAQTFQIAAASAGPGIGRTSADMGGRILFDPDLTYAEFAERLRRDTQIRKTNITDEYTGADLAAEIEPSGTVLFVVRGNQLLIQSASSPGSLLRRAQAGDVVLWFPAVPVPADSLEAPD